MLAHMLPVYLIALLPSAAYPHFTHLGLKALREFALTEQVDNAMFRRAIHSQKTQAIEVLYSDPNVSVYPMNTLPGHEVLTKAKQDGLTYEHKVKLAQNPHPFYLEQTLVILATRGNFVAIKDLLPVYNRHSNPVSSKLFSEYLERYAKKAKQNLMAATLQIYRTGRTPGSTDDEQLVKDMRTHLCNPTVTPAEVIRHSGLFELRGHKQYDLLFYGDYRCASGTEPWGEIDYDTIMACKNGSPIDKKLGKWLAQPMNRFVLEQCLVSVSTSKNLAALDRVLKIYRKSRVAPQKYKDHVKYCKTYAESAGHDAEARHLWAAWKKDVPKPRQPLANRIGAALQRANPF